MSIIFPNAKRDTSAGHKRDLILECLKDTRCPMTAEQIREWLIERRLGTFTADAITVQLRQMEKAGTVRNPAPQQTGAWVHVRGLSR